MDWNRLTNGKGCVFELTDGYWTNGQVVIKGVMPLALRNLKDVEVISPGSAFASLIPKGHAHEVVSPQEEHDGVIKLIAGGIEVRIDPFYDKVLKEHIGSFTYMVHDYITIVLCVNDKGVAGAVMPIDPTVL